MNLGTFWPLILSAIPAATLAANAIWQTIRDWRSLHKREHNLIAPHLIEYPPLERALEKLDRRSEAYLDRLERDNNRQADEAEELRLDRDYGWDLARWWFNEAHRVRYELIKTRFDSNIKDAYPLLPPFESVIPRPVISETNKNSA